MPKKYQIVMFSMSSYNEWLGGVQNRNFHILNSLAKNEKVEKIVSIDYLPHNFRRFLKNWNKNLLTKIPLTPVKKGIFTKVFKVNEKLSVYSSVMPKISPKKFYHDLNDYLIKNGFKDYLVWSFYPLSVEYFDSLPAKFFVFDTVDNWAEHPSYLEFKERLITNYKTINQKANLIFTVSKDLQKIYDNHEKVHWISNGVDLKHYQQKYSLINRDIGEIKKPIIGYVGTIQDRFDADLVYYLAKNNQDMSFVFIGPVWYPIIEERLKIHSNVYVLGAKTYQEVPMYIQQFDVCINPHKIDDFIKSTNPMKIYEYLACQKPVVTTPAGDMEMFNDLIKITPDYPTFNQAIKDALVQDSEQLKEQRILGVKEQSWIKKVNEMIDLIDQKI